MNFFTSESDTDSDIESLPGETNTVLIDKIQHLLNELKYTLYNSMVQNDEHDAKSLKGMYTYHSLLLMLISYLMGMLDPAYKENEKQFPYIENENAKKIFDALKQYIQEVVNSKKDDDVILAYNTLYNLSNEDAFHFAKQHNVQD